MGEMLTKDNSADNRFSTILVLCLIAFGYGVFHAAGPGHGKVITASWLAGNQHRLVSGIALGSLLALFHGLSGMAVVLLGRFVLERTAMSVMGSAERPLRILSFGLIMLLGTGLVVKEVVDWRRTTRRLQGDSEDDSIAPAENLGGSILLLALAAGLVPCPGVVLVMLFCSAIGRTMMGMLLAFCVILGMAMTISLAGLLVILVKKRALKTLRIESERTRKTEHFLRLAGGILILLMGLFFLYISV